MEGTNLYFRTEEKIRVEGHAYIVKGSIEFYNTSDGCQWSEYKIKSLDSGIIKWLSIDNTYNEYSIYDQYIYNKSFDNYNIDRSGYREVDSGMAKVIESTGDVDVDLGDIVEFKEFEDISESKIISIEIWEDETEYSKGYYLDKSSIKKVDSVEINNISGKTNNIRKSDSSTIAIVAILIVGFLFFSAILAFKGNSNFKRMSDVIMGDSNFYYETSITSDLDNNQKADVYSTKLSIEEAANKIIEAINGEVEDVQENSEDYSVAIMTSDEYCLVYKSEDGETLVQVSSRSYTYSSNTSPYRSSYITRRYYRRYYYTNGYTSDNSRYSGNKNAYENYNDGTVNINPNNKYKTYSNSIRESSVGSRVSSGGGTSLGK